MIALMIAEQARPLNGVMIALMIAEQARPLNGVMIALMIAEQARPLNGLLHPDYGFAGAAHVTRDWICDRHMPILFNLPKVPRVRLDSWTL